jgi:hypothetical protein
MRLTKLIGFLLGLLLLTCIPSSILAQNAKPTPYRCQHYSSDPSDPVSSGLRGVLECYSGGLITLAEEIPADKYDLEPRLGATVGHNVGHVAFISDFACSKMSGFPAPKTRRVKGEADKDGMVEWLKSSMEFCKEAFSNLSDDKLGESIPWNGKPTCQDLAGKVISYDEKGSHTTHLPASAPRKMRPTTSQRKKMAVADPTNLQRKGFFPLSAKTSIARDKPTFRHTTSS